MKNPFKKSDEIQTAYEIERMKLWSAVWQYWRLDAQRTVQTATEHADKALEAFDARFTNPVDKL